MTNTVQANDTLKKNREQFNNELKMFINQKLFDKHIISEDMYWTAKELLLKQASWQNNWKCAVFLAAHFLYIDRNLNIRQEEF